MSRGSLSGADATARHCGLSGGERLRAGVCLLLYMCVAVALVSVDNPWLHTPYLEHIDSSMFFMGGKAWANGMTPYVDFTDSKGPLLWLLHVPAYLLSADTYAGIMPVMALTLGAALYFSWLTAVRISGGVRIALWAAAGMPLFWFLSFHFVETRAETYAQLPLTYLLYVTVSGMRDPRLLTRGMALWAGVSLGALLLIKWSFVAFGGLLVLGQLWSLRGGRKLWGYVACGLAGIAAACLPMGLYLGHVGALGAFMEEYFINTPATTDLGREGETLLMSLKAHVGMMVKLPEICLPTLLVMVGSFAAFRRFPQRTRLTVAVITVASLAIMAVTMQFEYYMQLIGFLGVCFLAWLASAFAVRLKGAARERFARLWPLGLAGGIMLCAAKGLLGGMVPWWNDGTPHDSGPANEAIAAWSAQRGIESPGIMYSGLGLGFGLKAHALPAARYWFHQVGATEAMNAEMAQTLSDRVADVVVISYAEHHEEVERAGYTLLWPATDDEARNTDWGCCVYVRERP